MIFFGKTTSRETWWPSWEFCEPTLIPLRWPCVRIDSFWSTQDRISTPGVPGLIASTFAWEIALGSFESPFVKEFP
jgi:hypothetical protein